MTVRLSHVRALLSGVVLASTLAAATSSAAFAADLDEPPPPYDEEYDQPKVWRQPDPDAPYGRTPPPPPPRYAERDDNPGCMPRWRIRERLAGQGWVDVHPVGRDGSIVTLEAVREESGRRFFLEVDRCSGALVDERPVAMARPFWPPHRWHGPY